jgi:hypothetical protein
MYFVIGAFAVPGSPKQPISIVVCTLAGILRYGVPLIFLARAICDLKQLRHSHN